MKHVFHPTVLREYDLRGIVGETLSDGDALALGRAFGSVARKCGHEAIAVGWDGRHSSPDLAAALSEGLTAVGVDAVQVGLGPSPMLYFATHHLAVGGGVMVTGSHNPPDYNGFKLTLGGDAFYGADILEIGRIAAEGDFDLAQNGKPEGSISQQPVFDAYVERLFRDFEPGRPLKVAWDAGNGAAGEAMKALCERLPGQHLLLYEDIDGRFPNHHPDPTVEKNLEDLKRCVIENGCDLGVAFDGDGDRIGAVDEKGQVLWGDQIMLLLARSVLKNNMGAPIIADVKASQILFDGIAEAGGDPVMWKTGHSLIKAKMKELKSPFAGEMSAHIFFADRYYGFDDALYAAVRLLNVAGNEVESLAAFRASLPAVCNTPEIRFDCPEERKFAVVEEVGERLAEEGAEVVSLDGVRVNCPEGWWLLRASNTQAVLVVRCEAADEEGLKALKGMVREQLHASGLDAPF
ncbi:MAG: phosphomannomutase/phosphoglucomutase [Kiloniellales bacterium]|nr:phosphomannomutase/phosphoglucomutase [Kiloniellales bacterium]